MTGQHEFEFDREERRVKCVKCKEYQNEVTDVLCPGLPSSLSADMRRRGYVESQTAKTEDWEL
jgi:hypothetical protein